MIRIWLASVATACVVMLPSIGLSQQTNEMIFHSGVDDVPPNICTDAGREKAMGGSQASRPRGNLHGSFHVEQTGQLVQRTDASAHLFAINFDQSRYLWRDIGGNAFYSGDLIPWESSWLLCITRRSAHFQWLDTSKPLLRILPADDSITDEGYYRRVHIEHYWHPSNRKLSLPKPSDRVWVLD